MTAICIMVLGTTSGAGKSWLATALCRYYQRQGLRVAPFKAQNMSNNARVVARPDGGLGEIGSAQYFQALAAGAKPSVLMNPLLLKPEADTHSQVVLLGEVNRELTQMPWRGRSEKVWPAIAKSLDELRATHDVVVIEGAGSPAEINLHASDIVNMRVARHANARCLLITDIDRGGAFAHLYGTWALLPQEEQALIKGFVLNKFRGDASLLAPAPQMLHELTSIPVMATLPMWREHGLPEEDGVFDDRSRSAGIIHTTVAVMAYPHLSNLDEFQALKNVRGLRLVWARSPADVAGADWMILPGSKSTRSDLAWLRAQGLDQSIIAHAAKGGHVLGICGGLQMLGEMISDPLGAEGAPGEVHGLALLPIRTEFSLRKELRHVHLQFGAFEGAWQFLSGLRVSGYEIHMGNSMADDAVASESAPELWRNAQGNVVGLYLHGMFENSSVIQAAFAQAGRGLDEVFEEMADFVSLHFSHDALSQLVSQP
ncbi:cobyric acid synthase [Variovorax sp. PCZ-1]|uniref:cobyric acid synthase n=1 Tax=Variovorax sp. PCZ-1 TaxID=2835533 RepID=UPI001BD0D627|nr:cobyric acid synthase [Variovorax sp. PCZ-1]MBS7807010.1 cobyric acid synthase [Variovorax sp. PCZ-1]